MKIPRWLKLQEEIDYLYFVLQQILDRFPKSPIEGMIDDATGYDAERRKEIRILITKIKKRKRAWSKETGNVAPTDMEDKILEFLGEQ